MLTNYTNKYQVFNHDKYHTYFALDCIYTKQIIDMLRYRHGDGIYRHYANPIKHRAGFALSDDLYLDYAYLSHLSPNIQTITDKYLLDLLRYYTLLTSYRTCPKIHINLYTVLLTAKNSRPTSKGYQDKATGNDSYQELSKIVHKVVVKIKRLHITRLFGRFENPVHLSAYNHIYSHLHRHGLIATTDTYSISRLVRYLDQLNDNTRSLVTVQVQRLKWVDYPKHQVYYSYLSTNPRPVHITPFQSSKRVVLSDTKITNTNQLALLAVNTFINYLLTDYKIQTKDTDYIFLNRNHVLSQSQLHLTYNSQLASTKGRHLCFHITKSNVASIDNKLNHFNTLGISPSILYHLTDQSLKSINTDSMGDLQATLLANKQYPDNQSKYVITAIRQHFDYMDKITSKQTKSSLKDKNKGNNTKISRPNQTNITLRLLALISLLGNSDDDVYSANQLNYQLIISTHNINLKSASINQLQLFRDKPT